MNPFHKFCQHYELDPTTVEAREQYTEYQHQLELFREAAGLAVSECGIRSQSFPYDGGNLEVIRAGKGRFILLSQSGGLYAQCHRDHLLVEHWRGDPDMGEDSGAQLEVTAEGGLRLALCGIPPDEAPRLAWFLGVELVEDDE